MLAPIMQRLAESDGEGDLIEEIVAAVANKEARQLSQEDYGRASGILEVLQSFTPPAGSITVVLPNGTRRKVPEFTHDEAYQQIRLAIRGWQESFSLTSEQVAAVILEVVATQPDPLQNGKPEPDVMTSVEQS